MKITWVVAADSSRARIFSVLGPNQQLWELENLVNPTGRMSGRELETEARGRFAGKNGQANTGEADVGAEKHEAELFARHVGQVLDKACLEQRFDTLNLIAEPRFLGLLRQNLGKETRQHVKSEIAKDLSGLNAHDIHQHLVLHETLR